jgi:hypothetical protein
VAKDEVTQLLTRMSSKAQKVAPGSLRKNRGLIVQQKNLVGQGERLDAPKVLESHLIITKS